MAFIDALTLQLEAGKGGDGVVRWRREKFKPMSGPGGGNGGNGGNVYAKATRDLGYLVYYQHKKKFKADNGVPGSKNGKEGARGEDLFLLFPVGTIITNKTTGLVYELLEADQEILLLDGGRGGLGNEHFKSSRNVTPLESTPGKPGESGEFFVELRLIADIGLVGLPNAGKSTLLNMLTNAKSKVGSYQFTTLEPHLGVLPDGQILADIPGLIEGASAGRGLGHAFLRHIVRTKKIAHIVALDEEDPIHNYEMIREELRQHDPLLVEKDEVIIFSKQDMIDEKTASDIEKKFKKKYPKIKTIIVSAYDDASIKKLVQFLSV